MKRQPLNFWGRVENGFVFVVLFMAMGGINAFVPKDSAFLSEGEYGDFLPLNIFWRTVHLLVLFILFRRWRDIQKTVRLDIFFPLLVIVITLSMMWSEFPGETLHRLVPLFSNALFGIYFALYWRISDQFNLIKRALIALMIACYVVSICLPEYGRDFGELAMGAWQGIVGSKNEMGRLMVLMALMFYIDYKGRGKTWGNRLGFIAAIFLIFMSRSANAILILFMLLVLIPIYESLVWDRFKRIPFIILLLLTIGFVVALIFLNLDFILGILGKDRTLTGRMGFWPIILETLKKKPWLGYGYSAFWVHGGSGYTFIQAYQESKKFSHSHNAYLDICLQIGIVGLMIFLAGLARAYLKSVTFLMERKSREYLWTTVFLSFLVLCNMVETGIITNNHIFFIVYVATIYSLVLVEKADTLKPGNSLNEKMHIASGLP